MPIVSSLSILSSYSTLGETYHLIWCGRQLDHELKEQMVVLPGWKKTSSRPYRIRPKSGSRRIVKTVQPHAIWALAWLSKLVSLWCRCCRTAEGVDVATRTLGTDGGTGGWGRTLNSVPDPVGMSHHRGI